MVERYPLGAIELGIKDRLLLWVVLTMETSCGISSVSTILCPASQWLLPSTVLFAHITPGLEGSLSGLETLQGFFAQNKGPLSGSSLLGVGWDLTHTAGVKRGQELKKEKKERKRQARIIEGEGREGRELPQRISRLRGKYNLANKPIMGEESRAMGKTMGFWYWSCSWFTSMVPALACL